jgi:zinc transporter ZupT
VAGTSVATAAGVGMVAAATLAAAWIACRGAGRQQMWFGAAGGALLAIALLHLLPDAWRGAHAEGLPSWVVPGVAAASLAINVAIGRVGCACVSDGQHAGGARSAAALALHRFLEGATLALTGMMTAVALTVHAFGEGLAVGTLLAGRPRRLTTWVTVMCGGPAVGALATGAVPAVHVAEPMVLAVAAGVLIQAARISLRAAVMRPTPSRRVLTTPIAAAAVSASLTALAVYGVG